MKKKNWHYKITSRSGHFPKNWIVGTPIKVFGLVIAILWKIADKNYKWAK